MTLHDRRRHAQTALSAYLAAKGEPHDPRYVGEEAFGDLLADMRHIADACGFDWAHLVARAERHAAAERAEADRTLATRRPPPAPQR